MTANTQITSEQREAAELEIREKQKLIDYDTRDYSVEMLMRKYLDGIKNNKNKLFIPAYQRKFVWDERRQSEFIESILLGFPISSLIFAKDRNSERLEIIDGGQRIRTLANFLNNEFKLKNLKEIKKLNGFRFSDLPLARQKRFQRSTLRAIVLTDNTNEDVIQSIFECINNTGGV
ncbi:DUF262 domain-containing protein [Oscillatoriales cyanobacterium LEGE 11467]|uniref:DUF262 domain-containing protein n=1 Tax=Zarconia navalis LEGE 11467 TaxID=1828826 RepID=A0A928VXM0_9CYAN|nr:DUF262 domain-containing protein [Zarconia navalis]MBE9040141.1 DUF262 domain-containing protein [Zarconia navalis LEGE 11467]